MEVSKVQLGDKVLIDLTEDTVTESNLLKGQRAHGADGREIIGALIAHNVIDSLDSYSTEDGLSANQGRILNEKMPTEQTVADWGFAQNDDIPTSLSDLQEDETHRTVTDEDIAKWNAGGGDVPTKLSELEDDATHRLVTDTEKSTWNAKSDFDGNYNNLSNKPFIPTKLSELFQDSTHKTVTSAQIDKWTNSSNTIFASTDDIRWEAESSMDEEGYEIVTLFPYLTDEVKDTLETVGELADRKSVWDKASTDASDALEQIDNLGGDVSDVKESLIQLYDDGFASRNLYYDSVSDLKDALKINQGTGLNVNGDVLAIGVGSGVTYKGYYLRDYPFFNKYNGQTLKGSLDIKATSSGKTRVFGKDVDVTTEWSRVDFDVIASSSDFTFYGGTMASSATTDQTVYIKNIQFEISNVATPYTPYAISNVGLTKLVDDAIDGGYIQNKNLWDGTVNKGLWIVNNVITSNASGQYTIVKCKGGKTYTVSKKNLGILWIASTSAYPSANVPILDVQQGGSSNTKVATITTSANANYLIVEFGAGGTIEPSTYEELMIEESASATPYVERVPSNTELKQSLAQLTTPTYINSANISRYISAVNPSVVDFVGGNDNFITICGNVVTISLRIRVLQAISASTKIFTIDNSIKPFGFSQSSNGIAFPLVRTWDRTDMAFATISNYFDGIALIGAHPTGDYFGTVTFIKA